MRGLVALVLVALAWPASAGAHASLVGGVPEPGGVVARAPGVVALRFDEAVDAQLASVKVEDERGRRWDAGRVRGGGDGRSVRVALRAGAPHGRYAVLYRVVSDDGHTIPGGFGFAIGREVAPPPARLDVGGGDVGAGGGVGVATAVARAVRDAGVTVAIGTLLFGLLVWPSALADATGAAIHWRTAAGRFARASCRLLRGAALLGAAASASLLLLAAEPSGVSTTTLGAVLETRFGRFTALAGLALLALAAAAASPLPRRTAVRPAPAPAHPLRAVQLGATGLAVARPAVAPAAALAAGLALLVVLAGHATTRAHPVLLTASGALHVLAASAWAGGIAALLMALAPAARALPADDRARLWSAVLRRFSRVAVLAVGALAVTGVVQAVVEVGTPGALLDAAFGRAVVIKVGLLVFVLGIAAGHRLDAAVAATRATLRAEALGLVAILVATGVLAGSAPSGGAPPGPARVELAFQQAIARGTWSDGVLQLSLARPNGYAFSDLERIAVVARGPGGRVARATAPARRDGAYRLPLRLAADGTWRLTLRLEVDAYNAYTRTTEVTVR
jgi:copper transport protein